ncbi:MAG: NifU family protein [Actinomycetota bacterium]
MSTESEELAATGEAIAGMQGEEMDIEQAFARIGEIAGELEQHPDPDVKNKVFEMLDWVEAFHREAVTRIVQMLPYEAVETLHADPVVNHLLDTYIEDEESPVDLDNLIEEALEEIRPYVHSHGGEMEVLGVDKEHGIVKLNLMGSCHGCPSSSLTLTQGVETKLKEKWPGFRKLEVEGAEDAPAPGKLLQINTLKRS